MGLGEAYNLESQLMALFQSLVCSFIHSNTKHLLLGAELYTNKEQDIGRFKYWLYH